MKLIKTIAIIALFAGNSATSIAGSITAFYNDFNGLNPAEFSGVTNLESVQGFNGFGTGSNVFSGNFLRNSSGGDFGGGGAIGVPSDKTTLTLTGLESHTSIDINYLLGVIDSWDGVDTPVPHNPDVFNVSVDGVNIFSSAFHNGYFPPSGVLLTAPPFSSLGFNGSYIDVPYNMGLDSNFDSIAHTSSSLTIEWYASGAGWQGGIDESFAIDNVEVILNGTNSEVPEPSTYMLLIIGLFSARFLRFHKETKSA